MRLEYWSERQPQTWERWDDMKMRKTTLLTRLKAESPQDLELVVEARKTSGRTGDHLFP